MAISMMKPVRIHLKSEHREDSIVLRLQGKAGITVGIPRGNLDPCPSPMDSEYWPAVENLHRLKKSGMTVHWKSLTIPHLDATSRFRTEKEEIWSLRISSGPCSILTSNYIALCAKAADFGYNLVIVLSGLFNDLRQQTQFRLLKELAGTEKDTRFPGIHIHCENYKK